jgi:putative flavoprotein involved in K+ transport
LVPHSTGYEPGFSWIHLPVFGPHEPLHEGGVVPAQPGLYLVGLHFLYALSSGSIHGVGRDAERTVRHIEAGNCRPVLAGVDRRLATGQH